MRLEQFQQSLQRWAGSLIKVEQLRHPHAKEYMHQLAGRGLVERVAWGWYWVPAPLRDAWDFLARDKNFKIVAGQTAASVWNGDFVHREVYVVKVVDPAYGRALKEFGRRRGWGFEVEYPARLPTYTKADGLNVESPDETVLDCLRRWAFLDAFAVLYGHPDLDVKGLERQAYWRRLPGTSLRLKPIIEYGYARLHGREHRQLGEPFVQRELDEAVEKVLDVA